MICQLLRCAPAILLAFAGACASATTVSFSTTSSTQNLSAAGTAVEFKYTTGPGSGGKALASQEFIINGAASGATTTNYESANYVFNFGSTIGAGSTVTAATLDLSTAVSQAMALAAYSFESYPKSFTTNTGGGGCAGGRIGPDVVGGATGNCQVDVLTQSVAPGPRKVISLTIGAITHTFNGTVGVNISTLGTLDLATLNPAFLVELGAGNSISVTWRQLVSVTGSVGTIGDNMLCKDCTAYYAVTSSSSQNSALTALFNATFTSGDVGITEQLPEPASWLAMASGLALLAAVRLRRR